MLRAGLSVTRHRKAVTRWRACHGLGGRRFRERQLQHLSEHDDERKGHRGSPAPWSVDPLITAETRQPTFAGNPCSRCGSRIRFAKSKKGTCVRCHKQWRRDYERNSKTSNSSLYRNCGISPEEYARLCEEQEWRCAICKEVPKKLVGDHCHSRGNFRGLICSHCNSGLGFFKDSPERMLAAIEYLRSC